MLNVIIIVLVVYLLLDHCLPKEGITNYNQIRSDYEWTDYYGKQFDDMRERTVGDS